MDEIEPFDNDYAMRTGMVDDPDADDADDAEFVIQTTAIDSPTRTLDARWNIEELEELATIHGINSYAVGYNTDVTGRESIIIDGEVELINNNYEGTLNRIRYEEQQQQQQQQQFSEDSNMIFQEISRLFCMNEVMPFLESLLDGYVSTGKIDSWRLMEHHTEDSFNNIIRVLLKKQDLSISFDF